MATKIEIIIKALLTIVALVWLNMHVVPAGIEADMLVGAIVTSNFFALLPLGFLWGLEFTK